MACTITITSFLGAVSGGSSVPTSFQVNGTATGCPSGKVRVSVNCGGGIVSETVTVSPGGTWTATLPNDHGCPCEKPIFIEASCTDDPECRKVVEGPLECRQVQPQPCHAIGDLSVKVEGCAGGGATATATFEFTLTPPIAGCTYEWDFGDGSSATTSVPSVTHPYSASGTFTATVKATCPSPTGGTCFVRDTVTFTIKPCGGCPTVIDLTVTPSGRGCAGSGTAATVTFSGTLTPPLSGCSFLWAFSDGVMMSTGVPSITRTFTTPGTYSVSVTPSCPDIPICSTTTKPFVIPPCCPILTDIEFNLQDQECANGMGTTATMNFHAVTNPSPAAGTYAWDFGDGSTETNPGPNASHEYSSPGSYTVQVTYTPDAATHPGCERQTVTKTGVTVPACPGQPPPPDDDEDDDDDGGEGFGCFWLRIIMTVSAIFALVAAALAACIPPAAPALFVIAGILAAVAFIAGIFWAIFCSKPCGWGLLLAWQVAIGAGLILLCFTTCCPSFWIIGPLLVLIGIGLLFAWKERCHKSNCAVMKELLIALSGVVLPVLGWLGVIPVLAACINPLAVGALTSLAAIVAISAATCDS